MQRFVARSGVRLVLAVVVAAGMLALAPAASAQVAAPTIEVSPSTDLLTGQEVTVVGTDWEPDADVLVGMCPADATITEACDSRFVTIVQTDSEGSFSTPYNVSRNLIGALTGTPIDCVVTECAVSAAPELISTPVHAPVSFRDVVEPPLEPAITVTPSTDLLGGDVLAVEGTGFVPGVGVYVLMCSSTAVSIATCDVRGLPTPVTPDPTGAFSTEIVALRHITVGFSSTESFDCLVHECVVGAADFDLVSVASAPVSFSAGQRPLDAVPSTGLADLDTVQVSGEGFRTGFPLRIVQCGPETVVPTPTDCDTARSVSATVDSGGAINAAFTVTREIPTSVGGVSVLYDCAQGGCALWAGGPSQFADAVAPIEFADTPLSERVLSTSPVEDAIGETLVTGSGFTPGVTHRVEFCGAGSAIVCFYLNQTDVVPDVNGEFSLTVAVRRMSLDNIFAPQGLDCLLDIGCTIRVSRLVVVAETPVQFATPELDITIASAATLRAGTNEVVAQGTLSCDVATPVSFEGVVFQPPGSSSPGVAGGITVDDQWCEPGEPLDLFIPTNVLSANDVDFALGTATVGVMATPHESHTQGVPTAASADVQLVDFGTILAIVQGLLGDPANAELKAAIERAIRIRVAQDPVFRAVFLALITAV